MKELIEFLEKEFPNGCTFVTPQFERTEKLKYDWIPETKEEFTAIVDKAPWEVLKGFGFGKWDKLSDVIAENASIPESDPVSIPIINAPGETLDVDCGHGTHPTKLEGSDKMIILFPGEWYNIIPDGFIVTGLYGEEYPFEKGKSDDDIRFGCLPYGIKREIDET